MYQRNLMIEKEIHCDVAVIGGGTAGTYAAICAAQNGADTVLIEKCSMLGGTMTNGRVNFPGLFHAWGKQIIGGPCWQAIQRTAELGGAVIPEIRYRPENHWDQQILVQPFLYAAVTEQMCVESGVTLYYHTTIAFCEETSKGIALCAVGKQGMCVIYANRVIDCTGDANIVQMLGYAVEKSASLQPATLMNDIAGYDMQRIDPLEVERRYEAAVRTGTIRPSDFQGCSPMVSLKANRIYMHIACPDTSTSRQKTALEVTARQTLMRIVSFFRTIQGAENLYVSDFAAECGVRESVQIIGESRMTVENYLSGYVYPDALAYCFYPVDRHIPDGIKQIYLEESVVPTIPLGALIPKGSDSLLAAGRCAAGDADANSAYRVQAACMAMGQVAGTAAALSARESRRISDLEMQTLREALQAIGAIVPPTVSSGKI